MNKSFSKNNISPKTIKKIAIVPILLFTLYFSVGYKNIYLQHSIFQTEEWLAPPEADKLKNPFTGDIKSTEKGKVLYGIYCTPCHGEKGKGDGSASLSIKTKPADHTSPKIQKQSDGAIYWKLTEGRSSLEMVSYKYALSDNERWYLVNYIRTLTVK